MTDDIMRELRRLGEQVESLDHAIRGNGSPGLRSDHNTLAERVAGVQRRVAWLIGLVTTIAGAAIIFMVTHAP